MVNIRVEVSGDNIDVVAMMGGAIVSGHSCHLFVAELFVVHI